MSLHRHEVQRRGACQTGHPLAAAGKGTVDASGHPTSAGDGTADDLLPDALQGVRAANPEADAEELEETGPGHSGGGWTLQEEVNVVIGQDGQNGHLVKMKMGLAPNVAGPIVSLFVEQVRTEAAGALHRLIEFPLTDLRLVAAKQDLRNLPAFVVGGTGVDGCSEDIVLKAVGEG